VLRNPKHTAEQTPAPKARITMRIWALAESSADQVEQVQALQPVDGQIAGEKVQVQASITVEKSVEHGMDYEKMVLQHSVNVIGGLRTDKDGRHRHNDQQSDSGFCQVPHSRLCIALEVGSCQYHRLPILPIADTYPTR